MTTETTSREYVIDATGKRLGRVATEAATVLNGKDSVEFAKHIVPEVTVRIENASKLDIRIGKEKEEYQSYSGYPSGRRVERLDHLAKRLGFAEVVRRTVNGMLPKNKLQKRKMQNLIVTE